MKMKRQHFLFYFCVLFYSGYSVTYQDNLNKVDSEILKTVTNETVNFLSSQIIETCGEPHPSLWAAYKQKIRNFLHQKEVQKAVNGAGGNSRIYPLVKDKLAQAEHGNLISMWFDQVVCPVYDPNMPDPFAWLTLYLNNAILSCGTDQQRTLKPDEIAKIRGCKYPDHQALGVILDSNYKNDSNFYQKWSDHSPFRKEQIFSLWLARAGLSSNSWSN
jgi:hypothetical protein